MALAKQLSIVGITDGKFKPEGATASTDIFGIESLDLDFDGFTQQAEGDGKVISYQSLKKGAKVTVKNAIMDLKAFAALTGDVVTDAGVTPSQTSTLNFTTASAPYGVLEGQGTIIDLPQGVTDTKPADIHFKLPVFKLDTGSLKFGLAIGKVQGFDFSGYAIPDGTGIIATIALNETAVPIA